MGEGLDSRIIFFQDFNKAIRDYSRQIDSEKTPVLDLSVMMKDLYLTEEQAKVWAEMTENDNLELVLELIESGNKLFPDVKSIADYGCGDGQKSLKVYRSLNGDKAEGTLNLIDYSNSILEVARSHCIANGIPKGKVHTHDPVDLLKMGQILEKEDETLHLFLGQTIGNFEKEKRKKILENIVANMEVHEHLVVEWEWNEPENYNDEKSREFIDTFNSNLGIPVEAVGDYKVEIGTDDNGEEANVISYIVERNLSSNDGSWEIRTDDNEDNTHRLYPGTKVVVAKSRRLNEDKVRNIFERHNLEARLTAEPKGNKRGIIFEKVREKKGKTRNTLLTVAALGLLLVGGIGYVLNGNNNDSSGDTKPAIAEKADLSQQAPLDDIVGGSDEVKVIDMSGKPIPLYTNEMVGTMVRYPTVFESHDELDKKLEEANSLLEKLCIDKSKIEGNTLFCREQYWKYDKILGISWEKGNIFDFRAPSGENAWDDQEENVQNQSYRVYLTTREDELFGQLTNRKILLGNVDVDEKELKNLSDIIASWQYYTLRHERLYRSFVNSPLVGRTDKPLTVYKGTPMTVSDEWSGKMFEELLREFCDLSFVSVYDFKTRDFYKMTGEFISSVQKITSNRESHELGFNLGSRFNPYRFTSNTADLALRRTRMIGDTILFLPGVDPNLSQGIGMDSFFQSETGYELANLFLSCSTIDVGKVDCSVDKDVAEDYPSVELKCASLTINELIADLRTEDIRDVQLKQWDDGKYEVVMEVAETKEKDKTIFHSPIMSPLSPNQQQASISSREDIFIFDTNEKAMDSLVYVLLRAEKEVFSNCRIDKDSRDIKGELQKYFVERFLPEVFLHYNVTDEQGEDIAPGTIDFRKVKGYELKLRYNSRSSLPYNPSFPISPGIGPLGIGGGISLGPSISSFQNPLMTREFTGLEIDVIFYDGRRAKYTATVPEKDNDTKVKKVLSLTQLEDGELQGTIERAAMDSIQNPTGSIAGLSCGLIQAIANEPYDDYYKDLETDEAKRKFEQFGPVMMVERNVTRLPLFSYQKQTKRIILKPLATGTTYERAKEFVDLIRTHIEANMLAEQKRQETLEKERKDIEDYLKKSALEDVDKKTNEDKKERPRTIDEIIQDECKSSPVDEFGVGECEYNKREYVDNGSTYYEIKAVRTKLLKFAYMGTGPDKIIPCSYDCLGFYLNTKYVESAVITPVKGIEITDRVDLTITHNFTGMWRHSEEILKFKEKRYFMSTEDAQQIIDFIEKYKNRKS